MNNPTDTFSMMTNVDGDVAEIFLYGYIGDDWWIEEDEQIIAKNFVKTLNELEKKYSRINIRINSPGGSVYHGNPIVSAIQRSKAEIHTYNDGMAASMAFNIWAAAKHRHAAKNSTFMYHQMIGGAFGNAKDIRDVADFLDQYDETAQVIVADAFGLSLDEFKAQYADYSDHWINYNMAIELGLMTDKEEYETEAVLPGVENKSYAEVLATYMDKKPDAMNFIQKIRASIRSNKPKNSTTNQSNIDMKKDDLKKSLEDGTLSIEAATEVMNAAGYELTPKAPTPPVDEPTATATPSAEDIRSIIDEAIKPLQEANDKLKAQVESFGAAPAAPVAQVPAGEEDDPTGADDEDDELKKFNETIATAAKNGAAIPLI